MDRQIAKIQLPLYCYIPNRRGGKKYKRVTLNLNNYRNTHHIDLNNAKSSYSDQVYAILLEQYRGLKIDQPVQLTYVYYHPTRQLFDVANPCSIIDKYTCDALTKFGVWSDDSQKIVKSTRYLDGETHGLNPRCVLFIERFCKSPLYYD